MYQLIKNFAFYYRFLYFRFIFLLWRFEVCERNMQKAQIIMSFLV